MKKQRIIISFVLAFCMIFALSTTVYGESFTGDPDWNVQFTSGKEMVQNFTTQDLNDELRGFQPGDDAVFTIALKNTNSMSTDWYMENDILKSLEDNSYNKSAGGGTYGYQLLYSGPGGDRVLFDSETVGGDEYNTIAGQGLNEATDALDNWFYLDTLKEGQAGKITIKVMFEGETMPNAYQDTIADLSAQFAVEMPTGHIVKTGDDSSNWMLYLVLALATLALIVAVTVFVRSKRKEAV